MNLVILGNKYSIYQFDTNIILPAWIYESDFYSITKTKDEVSVVTMQSRPDLKDVKSSTDWRILKIEGPLGLNIVGIIADISAILKEKKIAVFVLSTYDTDYVMVKHRKLNSATKTLIEKGYNISFERNYILK